ncbi:hypothetical protein RV11_GL002667 [Enterococcus phoeniculicola]|jgi:hypothetical protein|uniref:Uncharacterized protein n=1 Tax=Enterococcus phoeniculicola ATCC BAA-412 TaxID=1158610 RepID=R3WZG8_9ENTE|nr:hypothetical protein [Enterococcus phoeniculicola]EOL47145.1 hypothetical protein UC3_00676 [Enterococcus phoeniculicola ATCC BAA-412]EOT72967.1 hypothetical protein I589_03238 [Enterococcus phoeniculicola ATCC BAA-412]OJG69426.1 hypothetical protein RV11_GL002667 [Enterococcus phoeniculicola]
MKKIILIAVIFIGGIFYSTTAKASVFGREEIPADTQETYFQENFLSEFSDSDKLTVLPDGGVLHGRATVSSVDDPSIIISTYDSATDSQAISVGELKKLYKAEKELSDLGYVYLSTDDKSTSVPTKIMSLDYGASYSSNKFTGSGWRFGGFLFKAINSPFPNLIWSSHVDSGLVGTKSQANYTHDNGSQSVYQGVFVNVDQRLSVSNTRVYYSYSPKDGTYYFVGNVDSKL